MKLRHLVITGIIAYLFFLALMAPASLVRTLLPDDIRELDVGRLEGRVWRGKAAYIRYQQRSFTDVQWDFLFSRLLLGRLAFDLDAGYAGQPVSTMAAVTPTGRLLLADTRATIPATELANIIQLPLGKLAGELEIELDEAEYQRGGVPLATGTIDWKQAAITVTETARLGDVAIELGGFDEGMLIARLTNEAGDIRINGDAVIEETGDYKVDISLLAGNTASNNVKNSLRMIAKQQGDGSFQVKHEGNIKELL